MLARVALILFVTACACAKPVLADDEDANASRDSREMITPAMEAAIANGLSWLAGRQQDDNSFGTTARFRHNPGVVALCGLAFLASGSTPGRGPYGEQIDRVTEFIIGKARANGYIVEDDWQYYHGPMYGHGFATLYLAEVYGMSQQDAVRDVLKRAVQLIIDSQNEQGGWRYTPGTDQADISVTVCQAMALRAARNAGISVPKEVIDRCVAYIEQSQNADGGFRYRLLESAEAKYPRSAAALVALYTSGIHEGPAIERGLDYLMQFVPRVDKTRNEDYFFYGHYYAAQATWHAGGDYWRIWFPAARDQLLDQQRSDGSWQHLWLGDEYATAMCLIVLQIPNNFLPIFER